MAQVHISEHVGMGGKQGAWRPRPEQGTCRDWAVASNIHDTGYLTVSIWDVGMQPNFILGSAVLLILVPRISPLHNCLMTIRCNPCPRSTAAPSHALNCPPLSDTNPPIVFDNVTILLFRLLPSGQGSAR